MAAFTLHKPVIKWSGLNAALMHESRGCLGGRLSSQQSGLIHTVVCQSCTGFLFFCKRERRKGGGCKWLIMISSTRASVSKVLVSPVFVVSERRMDPKASILHLRCFGAPVCAILVPRFQVSVLAPPRFQRPGAPDFGPPDFRAPSRSQHPVSRVVSTCI